MKRKKHLELAFFLLLLFVFTRCNKEDGGIAPIINQEFGYNVFDFYYLTNKNERTSFDTTSIYGRYHQDSTWIFGIKNNKRWMGLYEEPSKRLLREWNGEQAIGQGNKYFKFIPKFTHMPDDIYFVAFPMEGQYKTNNFFRLTSDNKIIQYTHPVNKEFDIKSIAPFTEDKILVSYYEDNIENNSILFTDARLYADNVSKNYPKELLTMFMAGFTKDNKVWFAECNKNQTPIKEWKTQQALNRNISVKKEEGKDTTFYAKNMDLVQAYPEKSLITATKFGFAANPKFNAEFNPYYFILNDGIAYFINHNGDMRNWYKESFIIDKTVYSPTAKVICQLQMLPEEAEPYDYKEAVYYKDKAIYRSNLETAEHIWVAKIDRLDKVNKTAEITISLSEKKDKVWEYSCHIEEKNGDKENFSFSVQMETGKLTYLN